MLNETENHLLSKKLSDFLNVAHKERYNILGVSVNRPLLSYRIFEKIFESIKEKEMRENERMLS